MPASVAVVSVSTPVATFLAFTVAPAITEPEGSETVPLNVPLSPCEKTTRAVTRPRQSVVFMINQPLEKQYQVIARLWVPPNVWFNRARFQRVLVHVLGQLPGYCHLKGIARGSVQVANITTGKNATHPRSRVQLFGGYMVIVRPSQSFRSLRLVPIGSKLDDSAVRSHVVRIGAEYANSGRVCRRNG